MGVIIYIIIDVTVSSDCITSAVTVKKLPEKATKGANGNAGDNRWLSDLGWRDLVVI